MSGAYTFIGMYAPFSLLRLPVAEKSRSPHSSTTTGLDNLVCFQPAQIITSQILSSVARSRVALLDAVSS
jgi:hypothetical protein